ncbi:molybdenum cofactor guanylyltransferase [Microbacterium sp. JZ31]|uniref:molybdenum cofactor guanylyltransferase n=1 Tax=Microbacterium sp. JZ31 TaxID=1906274 RepID=UPI0019337838|nr:NTP transferase domain-containing protein [Microbacterium sp. JZ31]
MTPLRGIVLAGGRSSRLGGRHKPAISIGGVPIVARAISALRAAGADPLVVGDPAGVPDGVAVVREDPPFAGPLAAVAAGVAALDPASGGVILLLGGDMPYVTPATLHALAQAAPAVAVDGDGRMQPLCAAWPEALLRERLARLGDPADRPLRILYDDVEPARVTIGAREAMDVDTPDLLRAALAEADAAGE